MHCRYATNWVLSKYRLRLSIDRAEKSKLSSLLSGDCGEHRDRPGASSLKLRDFQGGASLGWIKQAQANTVSEEGCARHPQGGTVFAPMFQTLNAARNR